MRKEFRYGPLGVYDFDSDDEIEVQIENDSGSMEVYLDRARATELRDWLTEQIECAKS